jgi:hypothetical protein
VDDIPYRAYEGETIPDVKDGDSPRARPREVSDGKARTFTLSDPEQLQAYNNVLDLIAKGRGMVWFEKVEWSEKRDSYVVFLKWIELFMEAPRRRGA